MTPQSAFMVAAPILPGRMEPLRSLLRGMVLRPGIADPDNAVLPFGRCERLHVARLLILEDRTLADLALHDGSSFPDAPVYLALLGDCDGSDATQLAEFATLAAPGLRRLFAHCAGFDDGVDLLAYMQAHVVRPAAQYVNWVGRTVRQVREEAALHAALRGWLDDNAALSDAPDPVALHGQLRRFVETECQAGRLALTDPEPTPRGWRIRQVTHAVGVPLLLLAVAPVLVLGAPFFLWALRRHEGRDPVIAPRPDAEHLNALARIEDHDVSNQFSAFGSVKPGLFRGMTLRGLLWVLNYTTRHLYTRGRLSRVGTIHFARWAYLDGGRRLFFASNYDGSLESYMDDFINKVAWGLNLVFSNGIGYPRTRFLILGGAKDEQGFKRYIRRHQLPTEVWYKAYPDLTTTDLDRNTRLRAGLRRSALTASEARQWLSWI